MCTGKTPAEGCILAVDAGGVARLRVTTPLGRALARLGVRRDGLVVYRVKSRASGGDGSASALPPSSATPKEGRTMKNTKVVSACQSAVKGKLQAVSLDAIQHAHARYKIAVTASYPGTVK